MLLTMTPCMIWLDMPKLRVGFWKVLPMLWDFHKDSIVEDEEDAPAEVALVCPLDRSWSV